MKLTINRKDWLRGEGGEKSRLYREDDGRLCCLGFYGLACGLNKNDMVDKPTPAQVPPDKRPAFGPLFKKTYLKRHAVYSLNRVCLRLIRINDRNTTSDAFKEKAIKNNFSKIGVKVTFVG
jgi:hypothetical protein